MKLARAKKRLPVNQPEKHNTPTKKYPKLSIEPAGEHIFTVKGSDDSHWKNLLKLGGKYNTHSKRWLFDEELKPAVKDYIQSGKVARPDVISGDTISRLDLFNKVEKSFEPETEYTSEQVLKILEELFNHGNST